jgi:hypothetical protein
LSRPAVSPARGTAAVLAVAVLAGLALRVQTARVRDPRLVYTRFDLPAYDAYAYVAMAEDPRFFTVAPWGHRVLAPALARAAVLGQPARVLRGFRIVTFAALVVAAASLWLFARRLGLTAWAALLGAAAFVISPPVAELLRNPYLTDPVLLAVETVFLLALQAGAGAPALALLAALGALAKESFLLLVPVVAFARWRSDGPRRALALTAAAAAAAITVTVLLRAWWTPQLEAPVPGLRPETLRAGGANLGAFLQRQPWGLSFLAAVAVTAALAARRREGRALLARYGYAGLAALAAPFFNPVVFSVGDVRRLIVHALPVLVPVALAALPRAWGPPSAAAPAARARRALAAAALLAALAPLGLDRYRRADLQGARDGPLVLGFCRESLRTARRLEGGDPVTYDPGERRFAWGVSDPGQLDRMRWFLREGWGDLPHYGTGAVRMQAARATLIVPVLTPRDLELTLALGGADASGTVLLNGQPVGAWTTGTSPAVRLPASAQFRGDNVLALERADGGGTGVTLDRLTLRVAAE